MYLNQFRGSVPALTDSSRNGNAARYPEHVTIASTSADVPSVKRTLEPWQDAISRLGMTWPDSTRESNLHALIEERPVVGCRRSPCLLAVAPILSGFGVRPRAPA